MHGLDIYKLCDIITFDTLVCVTIDIKSFYY